MLTLFLQLLCPSVAVDVDGLTPSSGCTFQYGIFFVFAIVVEDFFTNPSHVYYNKEWCKIPF